MFSYLKRFDWGITIPVLVLAAVSLVMMASVAPRLFIPQLIWFGLGILVAVGFGFIDFRPLQNHRGVIYGLYAVSVLLLIMTLAFAPTIRGSRSWLVLGPVQIQTSEFAKVALVVLLSYFFAKRHRNIARVSNIIIPLMYAAIPAVLVMRQPNLGTALVFIALWIGYVFASGIRPRHVAIGLVIAAIAGAVGWNLVLKPYQKDRIIGFINPEYDPLGINYNVIQSKIAVGDGGFFGKGFRQGTQAQLGFLPEAQTDFVFAALTEEWGLLGAMVVVAAVLSLLLRIAWVALESENNFSRLLCLGAMIVFTLHFAVNVGSNVGLLPVVGVTFPFLSYGGSSLIANFMLIGMIQSIAARRSF